MSCLNSIVSIKDFCNPSNNRPSLSGYDIFDAPELSKHEVAAFIKEDILKVNSFIESVMETACVDISNDFLSALSANNYSVDLNRDYRDSTTFNNTILQSTNNDRGLTLSKVSLRSNDLKTLKIDKIYLNSDSVAQNVQIKIYDADEITILTVNVIKGVNSYNVDYTVKSRSCNIVLPSGQITVRGGQLICMVGCNGTVPNPCASTSSFNGGKVGGKESYGLGVSFSCLCDYDKLLCSLAKTFIGKLVYLKTRADLLDHRFWSDRFNAVVVYKGDDAKNKRKELLAEYDHTWNTLIQGMPTILKGYCGECIKCNGISYKSNI